MFRGYVEQVLARSCSICGVFGHTRSKVFEDFLSALTDLRVPGPDSPPPPIFVAATGNDGRSKVDYPVGYDLTVVAGAMNSKYERSSFSNYGTLKDQYILLPGGDPTLNAAGAPEESVGMGVDTSGGTTYCRGTSPAAAYASGLLALY